MRTYQAVYALLLCLPLRAHAQANLSVRFRSAGELEVQGTGFDPHSWIWITYDDQTDQDERIDEGPALQVDASGKLDLVRSAAFPCARTILATALLNGDPVAEATTSSPPCPAPPPLAAGLPADASATLAARALLDALRAATQRTDRRLVIGQALRGWDTLRLEEPVTELLDMGLPAPKLLEVDLTDFRAHGPELRTLLYAHAQLGGIIGLTSHAALEHQTVDLGKLADLTDPALDLVPLDPALADAAKWRSVLDEAATIISDLEAHGAVVLFRPLHESNLERPDPGHGFWWSGGDAAQFKALWQGAFKYLTQRRHVHNALWVYAANRNYGNVDPTLRYPGDDFVDIVGLDIYHDEMSDAKYGTAGYEAMVALGKPFAISEYGADHGDNTPASWHDGNERLPNDKVISVIKARYPATAIATAWYSHCIDSESVCAKRNNWQISDKRDPAALLLDPWAITR